MTLVKVLLRRASYHAEKLLKPRGNSELSRFRAGQGRWP